MYAIVNIAGQQTKVEANKFVYAHKLAGNVGDTVTLGNALLTDTFHPDRWDYLYSLQPGGGERQQERISVFFNQNDQLVSLSGDFKPGVSRDEAILGKTGGTDVTEPATQAPAEKSEVPAKPGSLLDQIQKDVDGVETVPVPTPEPLDTTEQ